MKLNIRRVPDVINGRLYTYTYWFGDIWFKVIPDGVVGNILLIFNNIVLNVNVTILPLVKLTPTSYTILNYVLLVYTLKLFDGICG